MPPDASPLSSRRETQIYLVWFALALGFHAWGVSVGWGCKNLPGQEFRQAQTALSAYWIKKDKNFSLAYPTPVLGKPWSIPMEFPLYQWAVVETSRVTGWGLTKAGRAVSITCFYLTLPALFLLLGDRQVPWGRRWLVLAVVLTCPLYIFYVRAFLIETMALMFALWSWVALERAVRTRHPGWLALAVIAGTGAGLVKITTYLLYLLPAGVCALGQLWRGRRAGRWRGDLAYMALATVVPAVIALWWVRQADAIKAGNPLADFLLSANLRDFNLGTSASRLSPTYWAMKWRIIRDELTWLPLAGGVALAGLLGARTRRWQAAGFTLLFLVPLGVFPVLYALHDYYYIANTLMLLTALGLLLVGVAENPRRCWLAPALTLVLIVGQAWRYGQHYYPSQQGANAEICAGGSQLTAALKALTRPDEMLVITGQDWNSMIPYYAERRALMLPHETSLNQTKLDLSFDRQADQRIGALLITDPDWSGKEDKAILVHRLSSWGLSDQPWLAWQNVRVFLPADRREEVIAYLGSHAESDLHWAQGSPPVPVPLPAWHGFRELTPAQQENFAGFFPRPERVLYTFDPVVVERDGVRELWAHPVWRAVFHLSAGPHRLRTALRFNTDAYQAGERERPTDGVELRLSTTGADRKIIVLAQRFLDPAGHPEDRGVVDIELPFALAREGKVELLIGPGRRGSNARDWLWIHGPVRFD